MIFWFLLAAFVWWAVGFASALYLWTDKLDVDGEALVINAVAAALLAPFFFACALLMYVTRGKPILKCRSGT